MVLLTMAQGPALAWGEPPRTSLWGRWVNWQVDEAAQTWLSQAWYSRKWKHVGRRREHFPQLLLLSSHLPQSRALRHWVVFFFIFESLHCFSIGEFYTQKEWTLLKYRRILQLLLDPPPKSPSQLHNLLLNNLPSPINAQISIPDHSLNQLYLTQRSRFL